MGAEEGKIAKHPCFCPYCDEEIEEVSFPYCGVCEVDAFTCPECRKTISKEVELCPECGAKIKN